MASVEKRATAGGPRYDVRWHEPDGRTRRKTFRLRRDADSWRRQVEQAETVGVVIDAKARRSLMRDVAEQWLASNPAKRQSSVAHDRTILGSHVAPVLGGRSVGSVTKADVQGLVNRWSTTQAPSTVRRQYATLRAVFAYAESADMIGRTPCRDVRLPSVGLVERPQLDTDQLSALAIQLGAGGPMIWLGAVLGLRWSEVAGLQAADVNAPAGMITVRRQLGRDGKLGPPKSAASVRALAAPAWLLALLRPLVDGQPADALLFTTKGGTPLSYTNWRARVWQPACKATGVTALRFHDLRSMAATALVMAGVDVKTAQARLGHATPALTLQVYARATAEADRAAAEAVGERFRPAG